MSRWPVFFLACALVLSFVNRAHADWLLNGTRLGALGFAYAGDAVTDGAGGAIIVWSELRGINYDIYARRIDAYGNSLWTADGVPVCTATGDQVTPVAIADGAGGAVIAWRDGRGGGTDVYAQRLNSTGAPTWAANGVAICTSTQDQVFIMIASDGAAGAIIAWQDSRSGTNYDIYARRVSAAGVPQWTADGVGVCTLVSFQTRPAPVSDGAGGVIIMWDDARNGASDIFAQRLNAAGAAQWTANGVPVSTASGAQSSIVATTDGAGGTIGCWIDTRSGNNDIYAQRLNPAGAPQWPADGARVCDEVNPQSAARIVSDGAGGIVVAWEDFRNLVDLDIYAQRLNASGVALWSETGVPLCLASGSQSDIALVSDGAAGAIAAWTDHRTGTEYDIFARRVDASGLSVWEFDGVPVSTATNDQGGPVAVSDASGGMITAWDDIRSGYSLMYAQRIEGRYGNWGRPEPTIKSAIDNPNDQGGRVIVRWLASQRDNYSLPGVAYYSVWRATDVSAFTAAQDGTHAVADPRRLSRESPAGTVWSEGTLAGPVYWEWIANLDAAYQPTYSYTAPTRQDSTAGFAPANYFKVVAHETPYPQAHAWESGTASARSVDNIAPAAPLLLAIQRSGQNAVLTWKPSDAADFSKYALYRASSAGVQAVPINFLIDATLPAFTDVGAADAGYHYVVAARDAHGNQSPPSNEVSLAGATHVGDTPSITALTVQAIPNPFSSETDLNIGAPEAGAATVEMFDIAGKRILSRPLGALQKGWQKVTLAAIDHEGRTIASGVYFCRVTMNGTTVTRKLVIAR